MTLAVLLGLGGTTALAEEAPLTPKQEWRNAQLMQYGGPNAVVENRGVAHIYDEDNETYLSLPYAVIDGMAVHGGDMILGEASEFGPPAGSGDDDIQHGVITKNLATRWPDGVVPWRFKWGGFNEIPKRQAQLKEAMDAIEEVSGVRFVPRTNEEKFISVVSGGSCSSVIGMSGGEQILTLHDSAHASCWNHKTIVHEFLHALGVYHEQARGDRDQYVTIHEDMIAKGYAHNFWRRSSSTIMVGAYDFDSVMHYGPTAFSKDPYVPTITTNPPGLPIGRAWQLSAGDIKTLQEMYPGPGRATDTQAPSAPSNLVASNPKKDSIDLSWTASQDNVGVTTYEIMGNGHIRGRTNNTTITIKNLTEGTPYNFSVLPGIRPAIPRAPATV